LCILLLLLLENGLMSCGGGGGGGANNQYIMYANVDCCVDYCWGILCGLLAVTQEQGANKRARGAGQTENVL
jgi:hypothetical protein